MRLPHTLMCLCASLLAACTTPPPQSGMPAGFASYDSKDRLQAVNAERVVYQVRNIENKPQADQAFWQLALKERLLKAGYVLVSEGPVESGARKGYYIETAAPRGAADYIYLVAIFVQDKQITVLESAGELAAYRAQRDKIFAALRSDGLGLNPSR